MLSIRRRAFSVMVKTSMVRLQLSKRPMNLLYTLLKHLCLYSPRSAPRDQTTNRLFIVLSCLTQKLNQYSSCFCFHVQRLVFSAVLAWCRGWDRWATIDTNLIIFHISYFSGPGDKHLPSSAPWPTCPLFMAPL